MGPRHPIQDHCHHSECPRDGLKGRKGKHRQGQREGRPRGGAEDTRDSTGGSWSSRSPKRTAQAMDQGTRCDTWRCQEAEEIQGAICQSQGSAKSHGPEVERVQESGKGKLEPAKRAVRRRKKEGSGTTAGGKGKTGCTPERDEGKDRKGGDLRRGGTSRRRREGGRRGSRSATMGRRRGRGGRGTRRRHDHRGPWQWEKIEIPDAVWGKEASEEGIEEVTCLRNESSQNGQPKPERWTIPAYGTHLVTGRGSQPHWAPFERPDYGGMKTSAKLSQGKPRKCEESRELEELRFMVRQAMRQEEEERREEAEFQLGLQGGEDLGLEILGLLAQEQETIPIWVYVLSTVHEETIFTRASTTRAPTPHGVVSHVMREVRERMRHQGHLEIVFVMPQPPPSWRWGEDALHLIADIQPGLGGTPILLVSMFGNGASEEYPEMGAHRSMGPTTCNSILRAYGKLDRCNERYTRCECYHRFHNKGQRQTLHMDKGDRVDLRISSLMEEGLDEMEDEEEFAFLQGKTKGKAKMRRNEGGEEEEKEETSMMAARDLRRTRVNTAYAYLVDENEPRFFVGENLDKHEYRWFIWETLRDSPSSQGKQYEVYIVRPNPPDLESKGIQAYVAEERGARGQSQTVILMDVEIMANQGMTSTGKKVYTESWRAAERVHERQTRHEFLKELQLSQLCRKKGTCILQMGGKPWREQDTDTWWLMEGTYGLLRILNQKPDIPVSCQTRWAQENLEVEEFEERWKEEEQERKRRRREEDEEQDDISWLQTKTRNKGAKGQKMRRKRRTLRREKLRREEGGNKPKRGNDEETDERRNAKQEARPSVAKQGMDKLPPPGNGKVSFNPTISIYKGTKETKAYDRTWENPYVEGMCKGMKGYEDNPFIKGFIEGIKYRTLEIDGKDEEEEADEEETEDKEKGESFLPITREGKEDEEEGGYLPLHRKEEEERPIDEETQEGHRERQGATIKLEGSIGEYRTCGNKERQDWQRVQEFALWFNTHHVIPDFEWERIRWRKESINWMSLPIWTHSKALELHYYTDGSVKGTKGGSATVLFVKDEEGWKMGGFLQNSQFQQQGKKISAHMMELDALMMTMKWCHDATKLQLHNFNSKPKIYIHFDAMAAGYGALGEYDGNPEEPKYVAVRAMEQALEFGMGVEVNAQHVRGHSGNPGNEAADLLAEDAIKTEC